jgi:diguanylate cyclase (GGDEF)-like protein/PAS domain S-box-containing protein
MSAPGTTGARDPAPSYTRPAVPNFFALVEQAPLIVARFDAEGRMAYINPAAEEVFGGDRRHWIGRTCVELATDLDAPFPWENPLRSVLHRGVEAVQERPWRALPEERWFRSRIVPERDAGGEVNGAIVFAEDVTEERRRERRLRRRIDMDPLSGVLNRASFLRTLESACASEQEEDRQFAVVFLDLDDFKEINDRFGHLAGDALLCSVAERLVTCVRPTDAVGRFGGDEFAVLLRSVPHEEDALGALRRIQEVISAPLAVDGVETRVTASMGLAMGCSFPSAYELLLSADRAMYNAKRMGPGSFEIIDGMTAQHDRAVASLESELRQAVAAGQMAVHYQPLVSLRDGKLKGIEALVRWNHPQRGMLGPQAFLPVAEQTASVVEIDRWVMEEVYRQVGEWKESYPSAAELQVSVNVSARTAMSRDFANRVVRAASDSGLEPGSLVIEITETTLMEANDATVAALAGLREAGFRVALDDFGTGYASLPYLRQFTFDLLKIERSFVSRLVEDPSERAIVRSIIGLAHALGLKVVAEGVETIDQRDRLRRLGCDFGQGYLFGRPVTAAEVEETFLA